MSIKVAADPQIGYLKVEIENDPERLAQLKTALSSYLNTRTEAPKWIWKLCDSLEVTPIPVPGA